MGNPSFKERLETESEKVKSMQKDRANLWRPKGITDGSEEAFQGVLNLFPHLFTKKHVCIALFYRRLGRNFTSSIVARRLRVFGPGDPPESTEESEAGCGRPWTRSHEKRAYSFHQQ